MLELDKIHCGDNCDLLGQLPRECIDLVVNLHATMIYQKLNYLPQNAPDRDDQAWEYVFVLSAGRPKSAQLLTKKNAKGGVSLWTGGTNKPRRRAAR